MRRMLSLFGVMITAFAQTYQPTGHVVAPMTIAPHNGAYVILAADMGQTISSNVTATWTLPQCPSVSVKTSQYVIVSNVGTTSVLTVDTSVSNFYGGLSTGTEITLTAGQSANLACDGSGNWLVNTGAGGGSGTVTHTTGALTSTAFAAGNGSGDVKTPSATSTIDASGNAIFAGSITTTPCSGCASSSDFSAGTDPGSTSTAFSILGPVTLGSSIRWRLPSSDTGGAVVSDGAATPSLLTMVPFSGTGNILRATSPSMSNATCTGICTGFGAGSGGVITASSICGAGPTTNCTVTVASLNMSTFTGVTNCYTATSPVSYTGIASSGTGPVSTVTLTYPSTSGVTCTVVGGPTTTLTVPSLTTTTVTSITGTTASSGGTVTAIGGSSVTSEGVCYATSANPTTPCTSDGTATPFTSSLTGLSAGTTYHYRAFATNAVGTGYGTDLTFTTTGSAVWTKGFTFTIDRTKAGPGNLSNFPVYISVSDPSLKDVAHGGAVTSSSGFDIAVFTNSSLTTNLPFEIESWDNVNGIVKAFTKLPTVNGSSAGSNSNAVLVWGNSAITAPINTGSFSPANVWDANFKAVYHLNASGANLNVNDSTGNAVNGSNGGGDPSHAATNTTGNLNGAGLFIAANHDQVTIAGGTGTALDITAALTLSLWVNPNTVTGNHVALWRGSGLPAQYGIMMQGTIWNSYFDNGGGNGTIGGGSVSIGSWTHTVYTFDGATGRTYNNSVLVSSAAAQIVSHNASSFIGADVVDVLYFDGIIDEVRISNVARSADWITTEYNNQNAPGNIGSANFLIWSEFI